MASELPCYKRQKSCEDHASDCFVQVANYDDTVKQLDCYYGIVKRQLLRYQSPTLGLFPALSTDGKRGYVRDSIYCAMATWSLYQAYRRIDDDRGKSYELGQSAVKCMRGILFCWLRQAGKVEAFKNDQSPRHALHTIFNLTTSEPYYSDEEYEHLQIDVPSLYLLFLVQMITSGLQVIYTMDEVNFVQNLVYYVERAYRTPDYGMWERGSKYHNGTPELHASSIGMAKAALEAINGCNLFGEKGASWSVIYVDIDAHNRNRSIFETLLPRESSSKNTDACLLPCISFPCFATHDAGHYSQTKEKIISKLKGDYGLKRFLRDGFGTVLEDLTRKHYGKGELKKFDSIESEWPIFFIYLIIDGMFKSDNKQVETYQQLLHKRVTKDKHGDVLIPRYYYVPKHSVDAERSEPGRQIRLPCKEIQPGSLFLWGQSLYIISQLLVDGLVQINELDPIRRYLPSYSRPRKTGRYSAFQGAASDLVVQVVLIAESMRLQAMMATYGIQTQTPHEVEPVQIWAPRELVKVYEYLGVNDKLGLKGRPPRPVGTLGTSKVYRICGQTVICYPLIFGVSDFYLSHDMALLLDDIKTDLQFVGKYWRLYGRPTVCLLIREDHMRDTHFKEMLDLMAMLKCGRCCGTKVRLGRLQNLLSTSCVEHLDFMHTGTDSTFQSKPFLQLVHLSAGYQSLTDIPKAICSSEPRTDFKEFIGKRTSDVVDEFKHATTLYSRSQLAGIIHEREGPNFLIDNVALSEHLEALNQQAGTVRNWTVVRYCSSLLQKLVDSISPFTTSLLVNGKQLTVGVLGHEETLVDKPLTPREIKDMLYNKVQPYDLYQAVLQQEIIVYLGKLISTNPTLFAGILMIRIGWIIRAMLIYMESFYTIRQGEDTLRPLDSLSPSELRRLVSRTLHICDKNNDCGSNTTTPLQRRQINGALTRVPQHFYENVWRILAKTPKGITLADYHLPQQPTMSDMTMRELNFSLLVELALSRVAVPEYRSIVVEMVMVIATILQRNPELEFREQVDLDKLVGEANALFRKDRKESADKAKDMRDFCSSPSNVTSRYLARAAVNHVLMTEVASETDLCTVS